eukprot:15182177-Alexandrium_andersonii.AAC.1
MSASLVGSEMCIRDRSWNGATPARSRNRTVSRATLAWKTSGRLRSAAAVSYTHLTLPTICSV